jgi:hypothetical protein
MVYKKYIKKDGKLYGPYTYESKRVDGKVISEYHGPTKNFNAKRYAWIFAAAVLVIFFAYLALNADFSKLTGHAVLSTQVSYDENQAARGNISLSLKQGELIPASSKIIFENAGQTYEYPLSELVSEQPVSGNFYIPGTDVSGAGDGYGIEGEKQVSPDVSFVLEIYPASEEPSAPANRTNEPNASEESSAVQTESSGTGSENTEANAGTPAETQTETTQSAETQTTETSEPSQSETQTPAETPAGASSPESSQAGPASTESSSSSETPESSPGTESSSGASSSETPGESSGETSPITGFFIRIYNFFLGLTPTGYAVNEGSSEVSGSASYGNPFEYEISGGEGVQLKSGSVYVSSTGQALPDDAVNVNVDGNNVIAETSYSEIENGFGSDYSGNGMKTITIDLSQLGLPLSEGDLKTSIVYNGNEIMSSSVALSSGKTSSNVTEMTNGTGLNITIEQPENMTIANETNATEANMTAVPFEFSEDYPQVITPDSVAYVLTDREKALISSEFGDNVKTTKSEIINGVLIRRYEFEGGNPWIEFTYNPNLSSEQLQYRISTDRMKWLKDLAQQLENREASQAPPQTLENYSI